MRLQIRVSLMSYKLSAAMPCLALLLAGCSGSLSSGSQPIELSGKWAELKSFPSTGVLNFQSDGSGWLGAYLEVGEIQRDSFGFNTGETVVRAGIKSGKLVGDLLIKPPLSLVESCPNFAAKRVPVVFKVRDNGNTLSAYWWRSMFTESCFEIPVRRQQYVLGRLNESGQVIASPPVYPAIDIVATILVFALITTVISAGAFYANAVSLLSVEERKAFEAQKINPAWYLIATTLLWLAIMWSDDVPVIAVLGALYAASALYDVRRNRKSLTELDVPDAFKKRIMLTAKISCASAVLTPCVSVVLGLV